MTDMNMAFAATAAVLTLLALAAVVLPLLRKDIDKATIEQGHANLQVLRDQLAELESDLRSGVLSADQFESARADLERRVLDESRQSVSVPALSRGSRRWRAPAMLVFLVPTFAVVLYLYLGNTDGLDVDDFAHQQAAEITPQQVESMTQQLAQRLKENPDDVEGWAMLGRATRMLQQFPESAQAWQRVAELAPGDADALANYAEALVLLAQGNLEGEPTRLLARALELDPTHAKSLALSGGAAFARADYPKAIEFWERLLALSGDDAELTTALNTGIAEAQSRIDQSPDAPARPNTRTTAKSSDTTGVSGSINGMVSLSPQMSAQVKPEDTVFVFARAKEGPRMPLAVARLKVSELPAPFHLDDSMAMVPDMKISDFENLVVGARVSRNNSASRASGDLEGFSEPVGPGSTSVRVLIDQSVP